MGTEQRPLPIFFALRKYSCGQLESEEPSQTVWRPTDTTPLAWNAFPDRENQSLLLRALPLNTIDSKNAGRETVGRTISFSPFADIIHSTANGYFKAGREARTSDGLDLQNSHWALNHNSGSSTVTVSVWRERVEPLSPEPQLGVFHSHCVSVTGACRATEPWTTTRGLPQSLCQCDGSVSSHWALNHNSGSSTVTVSVWRERVEPLSPEPQLGVFHSHCVSVTGACRATEPWTTTRGLPQSLCQCDGSVSSAWLSLKADSLTIFSCVDVGERVYIIQTQAR